MKNIIFICLILFSFAVNAQEKRLVWDYPVKPGSEEWKNLESNKAKVDACQVPAEILTSIPTNDLMNICLQYPLLYDVFAFENINSGLDKLFSDFNGIRELYQRKDLSSSLIKRYVQKIQSISLLDGKNSELEKGYFIISFDILEILLSRYNMQNDELKGTSKDILQHLVTGYEMKLKYVDYFKGAGFRVNFYSRAHIISQIDKESLSNLSQKDKNSILYTGMADEQSVNRINELSYQFIK